MKETYIFLKNSLFTQAVFLLFFIVFLIWLQSPLSSVSAHNAEHQTSRIIHVDEEGFTPTEITIQPNTEIIFENTGKEDHWPASDSHPTHTFYDGTSLQEHCSAPQTSASFDACEGIPPGQTWSFTFTTPGTYQFHDHLWPHLTGKVVVTGIEKAQEADKDSKNIFSSFFDSLQKFFYIISSFFLESDIKDDISLHAGNTEKDFYEKLKEQYTTITKDTDPRDAIEKLRKESAQNPKVSALCHDIIHEIGRTAYNKYDSFQKAARYQSDFCNSGYIHGVFEAYFQSTDKPKTGLARQCRDYASGGRKFDLWQCRHGVGHGFMYLTGGDLDKSLDLCQKEFSGNAAQTCQNGVYMEVFNREPLAKEKEFINPDNPFQTCRNQETGKGSCHLYLPTYLLNTQEKSFEEVFEACQGAKFKYQGICQQGVGSEAMKRNMSNPKEVFQLCQTGSYLRQRNCITSAVSIYINQTASLEAGQALCKKAPKHLKDACRETVEDSADLFESI